TFFKKNMNSYNTKRSLRELLKRLQQPSLSAKENLKKKSTPQNVKKPIPEYLPWKKIIADIIRKQGRTIEEIEFLKKCAKDYELLLSSVPEKRKLTVDWRLLGSLTGHELIQATAARVGLVPPVFKNDDGNKNPI